MHAETSVIQNRLFRKTSLSEVLSKERLPIHQYQYDHVDIYVQQWHCMALRNCYSNYEL